MGPGLSCSHPLAAGQGCSQERGPRIKGQSRRVQSGWEFCQRRQPNSRGEAASTSGVKMPKRVNQDHHARGAHQNHFFRKPWTLWEDRRKLLRHACLASSNPAYPRLGSPCPFIALCPSSFLPSHSDGLAQETSFPSTATSYGPQKKLLKGSCPLTKASSTLGFPLLGWEDRG